MKKFSKRYYKPEGWGPFNKSLLLGLEWTVPGSKNNTYTVTITDKGFECSCTGFTFHGKCKHITEVTERFDDELNWSYAP